jgi:pimeloyl-ACP methyl ester carboxylesterase
VAQADRTAASLTTIDPPIPWQHRVGHQRDWIWRGRRTRYAYARAADGAANRGPVLLIHGFGGSIGHWRHNMPVLAQHHTVYAVDLLGFGASQKGSAAYTTAFWVEQVYEFWRDLIGEPVVLVGHSIGSSICIALAAAHPEMVKAIVMFTLPDASVLESPAWLRPVTAALGVVLSPGLGLIKWLITRPLLFRPLFWLVRRPRIVQNWATAAYGDRTRVDDELVAVFSGPAYDRGSARALAAMVNAKPPRHLDYSARTLLPIIQVPMLLIWGKADRAVPPSLAAKFLPFNGQIQLIELDGAGHCPHDECPEPMNAQILSWIDGLTYGLT